MGNRLKTISIKNLPHSLFVFIDILNSTIVIAMCLKSAPHCNLNDDHEQQQCFYCTCYSLNGSDKSWRSMSDDANTIIHT